MFFLLFPNLVFANTSPNIIRLAGADRYATAVAITSNGWTQSDYAVLCYGENFPDALAAAPLAKKYNAPILLTTANILSDVTKQELINLKVKNVFIIGGIGVISSDVESQIQSMGITTNRIAGQDRYDTAIQIAKQVNTTPSTIFVVTGDDYADGLTVSSIAGIKQDPIILVPSDSLPDSVKNYTSSNTSINKTYVVGYSDVISDNVANQFPNSERIVGADKYARNIAVNQKFNNDFNTNGGCIATGEGFADALAGSIYAAKINEPIILVNNATSDNTKNYFQQRLASSNNIYVFGGIGVISDTLIHGLNGSTQSKSPGSNETLSASQIAQLLKPSIVFIEVFDSNGNEIGAASGVIATSDGKIFTNYHVVNGASSAKIKLSDGRILDVKNISGYDPKYDAVVLKVNANDLQPAKFNDSSSAQIGDKIYTLGNPGEFEDTISDGLISTIDRVINGETFIQFSAPISPGSSGGALINEQGEVIGITTAGLTNAQDINFAIPYEDFNSIKDQNLNITLGSNPDQQPTSTTTLNSSLGSMSDQQFEVYLNTNYSSFTIDNKTVNFTWEVNKFTTSADETISGHISKKDFLNWLQILIDEHKSEVENYFQNLNNIIANNYPDKSYMGCIIYQDIFNYYPSSFSSNEITYTGSGWRVTHLIIGFGDLKLNGISKKIVLIR